MFSLFLAKAIHLVGVRFYQFALIAIVFIPLERLIPFHPKQRLFRKFFLLDLLHYFVGGILIIIFVRLTYAFMPTLAAWTHVRPVFVLRNLPWWQQLLIFETGWTFLGYWLHRYEHVNPILWKMHSVHESSRELDWLSAFRLHPLEPALFQVATIMPLWLLGISQPAVIGYTVYAYITAHVQHANILLPIGPLKYIFPTPEFHRWHHARIRDANGVERPAIHNFGQYPIWDVIFGTLYLPSSRPASYGSAYCDQIPDTYMAQLAFPFGFEQTAAAWNQALWTGSRVRDVIYNARQSVAPLHDACENQLARLCLVRPVTPLYESEKI